jgi:hypothetical protein
MTDPRDTAFRSTIFPRLRWAALVILVCAAAIIGWRFWSRNNDRPDDLGQTDPATVQPESQVGHPAGDPSARTTFLTECAPESISSSPAPAERAAPDAHRLIQGTWQDDYQGRRTMTLREDGTGTMVVELAGINAKFVGPRLTFQMVWSLDEKRLTKRTVGGEPEGRVRAILAMMGDEVEEEILELTAERLLVTDGKQQFDWRRAEEE